MQIQTGNQGWPDKCKTFWHTFYKVDNDLPTIWKEYCHKCLKHEIVKLSAYYEKDTKAYTNIKVEITKMQKALKQFYVKNPDLALED